MEFIQTHIPTIPNWEGISDNIATKSEVFSDFIRNNWKGILFVAVVVFGVIYHNKSSKSKPEIQEPNPDLTTQNPYYLR
jgi:hypothetical protein